VDEDVRYNILTAGKKNVSQTTPTRAGGSRYIIIIIIIIIIVINCNWVATRWQWLFYM